MIKLNDKQLLEQFKLQEHELIERLNFIRLAIKTYGGTPSSINDDIKTDNDTSEYNKDDTWGNKVMFIIKSIKGGFVSDIVEEIMKKEPKLSRDAVFKRVTITTSRINRGKVPGKKLNHEQRGRKYFYYI